MTTKEWLNRARTIDREITALEDARRRAMGKCLSITAKPRDVIVSGGGGDTDGKLIAYVDLSAQIDAMIDELRGVKAEILAAIKTVEDGTLRTLLIERYINCKTWEQVAVDMNYCFRQIIRMHGEAIKKVVI